MESVASGLSTITVDTLVDENDGNLSVGDVSLREALSIVEAGGTIDFAERLAAADVGFGLGVIGLVLSELVVDKSVTIKGLGADRLTVSGNGESRVFRLDDGDAAIASEVRLEGLTVADGVADIAGGVLTAGENVTFVDMALNGNWGAIAATSAANISIAQSSLFNSQGFGIQTLGELRLADTQIINSDGVGIQHSGGLTLERSWVSDSAGNGIVASGRLALLDSQVASNGANGMVLNAGDITLQNSAVTGNRAAGIASSVAVNVALANSTVESNGAEGIVTFGDALVETSSVVNNGGDGVVGNDVTIAGGIVFGNGGIGIVGQSVAISDSEVVSNAGGNVVRTVAPVVNAPAPNVVTIGGDKDANRLRGSAAAERIRGYGGDDRLHGKDGNDVLEGGNGNDQMIGGRGDDILGGGGGRDLMRGGAGKDTFVYTKVAEGGDVILDFEVGQDRIDLSSILAETGYDSAQPFEDYVKLSRAGTGTVVSVLDAARSTADTPVFQMLAQLKTVELTEMTAKSFVL